MIPNLSNPGSGFRGVLTYDLKPAKDPEILGGTMRSETARGLAHEFAAWRALNEAVSKPVFHASLAAAPGDRLTAGQWLDIAGTFANCMGYAHSPWIAIRHHDRPIDHIHIVASRIDDQGRYVPNHLERKRAQEICRHLEREFGLTPIRTPSPRATPTRNHVAVFERTGLVTVKSRLQEHIDLAARDRPTMSAFVQRLEAQGIAVRANLAATGRVAGISFAHDGVAFKGGDLGRGYTWLQLQQRAGITYDPGRDLPTLRAAAARAAADIAIHKPLDRDPATPPMPPLERPAESFRQAAILESRAEIADRHHQLLGQLGATRDANAAARGHPEEGHRLDQSVSDASRRLDAALARIYCQPGPARERLAVMLDRDGHEAAAQTLEQRPAHLGALRGHGAGPFGTAARRDSLSAIPTAAFELRSLLAANAAAAAHHCQASAHAPSLPSGEHQAEAILAVLRRLPELGPIRRDLLQAGRALGLPAVHALSRRAAGVFAATTRLIGRAFGLQSSHELGLDRDDNGPGL
jgi:hypothetical protein